MTDHNSKKLFSIANTIATDIESRKKQELDYLLNIRVGSYSKRCFESGTHWKLHTQIFKSIGLDYANKDIKILDIGTWFGYIPYIFKKHGFKNVHSTEQENIILDSKSNLHEYHKYFGVDPFGLTIAPLTPMQLPEKYDVIIAMNSDFFWNKTPIIHWQLNNDEISYGQDKKLFTSDGDQVMSMSPWGVADFEFLVNDIKDNLTPGGVAVINPHPYLYTENSTDAAFAAVAKYLKTLQTDIEYIRYDTSTLTDYFIIRNTP
jgi:hypothetical protein